MKDNEKIKAILKAFVLLKKKDLFAKSKIK